MPNFCSNPKITIWKFDPSKKKPEGVRQAILSSTNINQKFWPLSPWLVSIILNLIAFCSLKGFDWQLLKIGSSDLALNRRQPLNLSPPSAAYIRQWIGSALVQIMACRLFGTKPLSKPMLGYCQLDSYEQISIKIQNFSFMKRHLKYRLRNGGHFVQGEMSKRKTTLTQMADAVWRYSHKRCWM